MSLQSYSALQIRELFHLEVLRRLGQRLAPAQYALKGGVNMRFFFGSPRYSEDMDLDAHGIEVAELKHVVMGILTARSFGEILRPFCIRSIVPPDMAKAKQTQTTQRFKVHLITSGGENLFTKIEFSRRGIEPGVAVESVRADILRSLRLPPLLCPHYTGPTAIQQKIGALAGRPAPQARDIFDLYLLSTQARPSGSEGSGGTRGIGKTALNKAMENIYMVDFRQFSDSVLAFFPEDERGQYADAGRWDEIRLVASQCIEGLL